MIDSLRTSFKIQIRLILNVFLLCTSKCISCHEWNMSLKAVSTFIHLFFKWNCIESISLQVGYYFYFVVKLVWCLAIKEIGFLTYYPLPQIELWYLPFILSSAINEFCILILILSSRPHVKIKKNFTKTKCGDTTLFLQRHNE